MESLQQKRVTCEMKNLLDWLQNRLQTPEERVCEDKSIEVTHAEREKIIKKNDQYLRDL